MSEENKFDLGNQQATPQKRKITVSGNNPSYVRAASKPIPPQPVLKEEKIEEPAKENKNTGNSFVRAYQMPATKVMDIDNPELPLEKEEETAILPMTQIPVQEEEIVEIKEEVVEQKPVSVKKQETTIQNKAVQAMEMLAKTKMTQQKLQQEQESIYDDNDEIFEEDENSSIMIEKEVGIGSFLEQTKETKQVSEKSEAVKPVKKAKQIDLSKLTIVNKTEMDKERDLRQALFNNKAAFQIVAAQSGYMAKVAPLVHKDLVNILYGNLGRYEYKKTVYKTVFDKIFDISAGKFDFDSWLKNTTVEDMETFYYGVYSSTFPNEGNFRYTCSSCGKEHDYKVNHANLIKTTDREHMKKLIEEVSRNSISMEKMKEYSLIGKNQAIQLSESSLIIELRTPSLFDSLEILRTVPEKTIDKDAISITNMLYINKVLIPTKEKNGYIEETDKPAILRVIDNLPIDDANELQSSVFDRVDSNRITYSIKNIKCVECSHEEKDIPISIEDILFTVIFEKAQ
jgi:hypothetical protein